MKTIKIPSALYPFTHSILDSFNYRQHTLNNVFSNISDTQREAFVELWLRNRVIPTRQAALQRSSQVCYMITDIATGNLVGVNTLYPDRLESSGPEFYFYRMFIDPDCRNTRLMITGTTAALYFAKLHLSNTGRLGVINVNENTKLSNNGMHRLFIAAGYTFLGQHDAKDVWLYEFENINIVSSLQSN